MRWERARRSDNVEDRRGSAPRKAAAAGGLGIVGIIVAFLLSGGDLSQLLGQLVSSQAQTKPGAETGGSTRSGVADPVDDQLATFVSHVLGDTEDTWRELLPKQSGVPYVEPTLHLFTDQVESACGFQTAATGPFYCPADRKVYIDVGFYATLRERLGADGDFAQAYVIAHEVGHHIQNLLGKSGEVHRARARQSEAEANDQSVRLELQADFYAGVWAHYAAKRGLLEPGDIEEALGAAAAIGDDRLQQRSRGFAVPESFTHGTSAQRVKWFKKGLETGDMRQGDTFAVRDL